ncbi:MAG: T9SS type A sorting domain-containing protein [Owenweeksia sp.]|nr:T9SS type A sorting domain-containing protein [Owenweeksia sp.]
MALYDVENNSWQKKTVNLSAFSGIIQIRFRGEDLDPVYYKDIAIDDVKVADKPLPCNMPVNVWATATDCDSIDVTWNTNSSNSIISYGPPGFSPGDPSSTSIAMLASPHTIGGLNPGTTYEVYVASVCNSDTTNFVGPVTDITFSGPLPLADFSLSHAIVNGNYEVYVDASASAKAERYSWSYLNGSSTSLQDTIIYTPSDKGPQNIRLIVSNGCGSDTILKTVNVKIGLKESSFDESLKIYPNPADEQLHIHFSSQSLNHEFTLSLSDISGREIMRETQPISSESYKLELNVSPLAPGVLRG